MPFKLSVKYHSIPKRLYIKYQRLFILDSDFITKESAIENVSKYYNHIKNDIFYENGRWKIRLYLFELPTHIYKNYINNKQIKTFESEHEAKKYAEKHFHTFLYAIEYFDSKNVINFVSLK
jgi:hypothetical protein